MLIICHPSVFQQAWDEADRMKNQICEATAWDVVASELHEVQVLTILNLTTGQLMHGEGTPTNAEDQKKVVQHSPFMKMLEASTN